MQLNMSEKGDRGITQGECLLEVSKNSVFPEAVGAIDDFQARLGSARVLLKSDDKKNVFEIEKDLYEVMGVLYLGGKWRRAEERIEDIDDRAEQYKSRVKNLGTFLIPGENETESRINLCRTGCRTAERKIVALKIDREENEKLDFDENILKYFNRLSYLLNWMWRSKF